MIPMMEHDNAMKGNQPTTPLQAIGDEKRRPGDRLATQRANEGGDAVDGQTLIAGG